MPAPKSRIAASLVMFLPGISLLGFNIGTDSVTTMAKAGVTYGMSLFWAVVTSCIATYFMIVTYGRYSLVTAETALQAFRKHLHPAVEPFSVVGTTLFFGLFIIRTTLVKEADGYWQILNSNSVIRWRQGF